MMKQLLLSIMLFATAMVASAQQQDHENFAKRLQEARLAEISLQLNLTDDQKAKFAPIYEQYCKEMREVGMGRGRGYGKAGHPGMRPGGPDKPSADGNTTSAERKRPEGPSDAEKVKRMKERMEKQKKAQEIRLAYTDKFATVLTDKQLIDFFEVENNIQEKLHNRAFQGRKGEKGGFPGRKGEKGDFPGRQGDKDGRHDHQRSQNEQ